MVNQIKKEALANSEPERIELYEKYFRCYPGGYGEGDTFAGIRNPPLRRLAKKHKNISIDDCFTMLCDKIHEIRLLALFILELKFKSKKTSELEKKEIAERYLLSLKYINNWDLVDLSAHHILGCWLYQKDATVLFDLANSNNLWRNRVAMIAAFYNIRQNSFELPVKIAEILVNHKHDIIHKAVGWMLREIGKRDIDVELEFLIKHYKTMPRTMLRYAIEKFDEPVRQKFLKGKY